MVPTCVRFKYLGLFLNDRLTSRDHISHMEVKTTRAVNSTLMTIRQMGISRLSETKLLFSSLVQSQMYGSQFLLHPCQLRKIDILQHRFHRSCYSLPNTIPDALIRLIFFPKYPEEIAAGLAVATIRQFLEGSDKSDPSLAFYTDFFDILPHGTGFCFFLKSLCDVG